VTFDIERTNDDELPYLVHAHILLLTVMLRSRLVLAAKSSTRLAGLISSRIVRQPCQHIVRYQSDKAGDARRKALEYRNDMMRDWDARILTYEDLKPKTLSPSPGAYLIDVREPDEAIQGSIPSSVNLPLSVLPTSLHLHARVFKEKHGFEKPLKDQEIIFYCRTGKRSATACDVAKRNGFTNLYNYEGSWVDWLTKESAKEQQSNVRFGRTSFRSYELMQTLDTILFKFRPVISRSKDITNCLMRP
jgi:rhodanese-related sulfurtransferase